MMVDSPMGRQGRHKNAQKIMLRLSRDQFSALACCFLDLQPIITTMGDWNRGARERLTEEVSWQLRQIPAGLRQKRREIAIRSKTMIPVFLSLSLSLCVRSRPPQGQSAVSTYY